MSMVQRKRPSKAVSLALRPMKLRELKEQPEGERRPNVAPHEARKRRRMDVLNLLAQRLRDSRETYTVAEMAVRIRRTHGGRLGLSAATIRKYLLSMFPKRMGCTEKRGPTVMHGGYWNYPDPDQ